MKRKAFTLVELIVVITILAILWTIAFISLSGYSKEARDSKRVTDTSSLLSKINIEEVKWRQFSELITDTTPTTLQILWTPDSEVETFWKANFENLKESPENFKDPSNKSQDYPLAFAIGWTWRDAYKFVQVATISEKDNKAIIKWSYYTVETNDAPSLFVKSGETEPLEDWGTNLPYLPDNEKSPDWGNEDWWNTSWGWETVNWTCKTYTAWNWTFTEWTPTEKDTAWQTTDSSWACYVKCNDWYDWWWDFCAEVISWQKVWTDPNTWYNWELNQSKEIREWAKCKYYKESSEDINDCRNYPEPIWDKDKGWYTYLDWKTEKNYPAFKHCTDLWAWWKLPTSEELETLMGHPEHSWSSTSSTSDLSSALVVDLKNPPYLYTISKNSVSYILCLHY